MNKDGDMVTHMAAKLGDVEIVSLLLSLGVDPNLRSSNGNTPLHWAACEGSRPTVKTLLSQGADILAKNHAGETVLMTSLHYTYHAHLVPYILRCEVAVNDVNSEGRTELHEAALRGHTRAIPVLLDIHADPSLQSRAGWTPLGEAAASGEETILQLLQDHNPYRSARVDVLLNSSRLRKSIEVGDKGTADNLLQYSSIDVNVPDHEGRTALHHAASDGQMELVRGLLQ